MSRTKVKDRLSVIEAMDILSSLAEIEGPSEEEKGSHSWLDLDLVDSNEEMIKEAFDTLHHYLERIHAEDITQLKDLQIRAGVGAIAHMLSEAVKKMQKFTPLFKEGFSKEYETLHKYLEAIPDAHEIVKEEKNSVVVEEGQTQRLESFQDLEDFKEDLHYELFYLKNEARQPFHNSECIKRLKLLYDSEKMGENDQMHSKLTLLESKDFQRKAIAILVGVNSLARDFYRSSLSDSENAWVLSLSKALMALMLSSNPQHLLPGEESSKMASDYFADFKSYLREAVTSKEYRSAVAGKMDAQDRRLALLTYKLCSSYFLSTCLQKEIVNLLRAIAGEASHLESGMVYEDVASEDEALRRALQKSPNGPIKKIIGAFLNGEMEQGWDPLMMKNTPSLVFTLVSETKEIPIMRMAAPVYQSSIRRAEIVKEFEAWINPSLIENRKKILLIDLQDSTSSLEYARTEVLKELWENSADKSALSLVRLAKKTDFYFQKDAYKELEEASVFIQNLEQQLEEGDLCGFWIPPELLGHISGFVKGYGSMIHEVFFDKKEHLSCRQRQDFIEIFYAFFSLKLIEWINPDSVVFISKDGLDTAVSSIAALFFCAKHLMAKQKFSEQDRDFIFWILYGAPLLVRERALHKQEALRCIHFLETFEKGSAKHRDVLLNKGAGKHGFIQDVKI